jgi:hypothetical protein
MGQDGGLEVEIEPDNLETDEDCVLQFLKNWPDAFVAGQEIARRAGGHERFLDDPRWAGSALAHLLELDLVESDGNDKYRMKNHSTVMCRGQRKFIAPELLEILAKSGRHFDLSE